MSIANRSMLSRGAAAISAVFVGGALLIATIEVNDLTRSTHAVGQSMTVIGTVARATAVDVAIHNASAPIVVSAEHAIGVSARTSESTAQGTEYMIDIKPNK